MKHANIAFFIPHIGCPNKCSFCNQNTISGKTHIPHAKDIISTLTKVTESFSKSDYAKSEIAFFGGSFTAIDKSYMVELLEATKDFVGDGKISGIRVSTRPDAISEEILDLLKKYHVTSIELGAQSMCNDVLLKNMRGHSAENVISASKLIKKFGFSLGLQMMTGLYGDSDDGAIFTAKQIIKLSPDTVRIYPTVVLKNTYLGELFEKGIYNPPQISETVSLCAKLIDMFEENDIKVIRVGLHDQPEIKENFMAGAYHPALGELIQGERMFNKTITIFLNNKIKKSNVTVTVNPSCLSQFIGQKKGNIERLEKEGYKVMFKTDKSVKIGDLKLN